jgi:hypothetical protein
MVDSTSSKYLDYGLRKSLEASEDAASVEGGQDEGIDLLGNTLSHKKLKVMRKNLYF